MREGEIVRVPDAYQPDGSFGAIAKAYPTGMGDAGVGEKCWPVDLLEIVTVAELFEAAGHPVPEGARLFAHFLVGDGMTASDVRRYWGWRLITEVGHFLNGAWQVDKIDEANASDPIRVISAVSIDLSRLPALDAWDALPEVIKAVVE